MFYDNKIVDKVCGDRSRFSIEHRSINAVIFASLIFAILALVTNIIFGLKEATILAAIGIVGITFIYLLGRVLKFFKVTVYLTYIVLLIYLSFNWILNGGSTGPTIYFYFSLLVEFTVITRGVKRVSAILGILLNILFLFILEKTQIEIIVQYSNEMQRSIDLYTSFIMNSMLMFLLVVYIYSTYRTEKEKAEVILHEKEERIDNIVKMAYYNITTKLPNRKMYDRIDLEEKFGKDIEKTYLIVLNIENYDVIVNNMSYEIGINYIEKFGKKLKFNFEKNGEVFHFEVNKFGIVLSAKDINIITCKINNMKNIILLDNITIYSELSIGVVKYDKKYSITELLKKAEAARSYAKKNLIEYAVFNDKMENDDIEKMQILGELKEAIRREELELYFQPKVDIINTGKLIGVEALIRWNHPVKGFIPPVKFIPYLEETTLINEVTKWVYETALKKIVKWNEMGINVKIAINISVTNLYDKEFHFYVEEMLREYKVNPEHIEFELTEGKSIQHFDSIILILKKLKEIGIKISIDDFGTGYSSLAYIKQLPIDTIKIDRMFIKNINEDKNNQKIVSAAISIAETFGLNVVAEGIESEDECNILKDMNCDIGQGFLFAKPMKEDEFLIWNKKTSRY